MSLTKVVNGVHVPLTPEEEQAVLADWAAAEAVMVPIGVPRAVTMRQARLALLGAGKLAAVESAIEAMAEPQRSAARIEWDYSNELQRSNPLVQALGPALGLTEAQIDALFVGAATL